MGILTNDMGMTIFFGSKILKHSTIIATTWSGDEIQKTPKGERPSETFSLESFRTNVYLFCSNPDVCRQILTAVTYHLDVFELALLGCSGVRLGIDVRHIAPSFDQYVIPFG